MRALQSTKKRPVFINGIRCESLTAGAKEASRILGREIRIWQIHRALTSKLRIPGLVVSDKKP